MVLVTYRPKLTVLKLYNIQILTKKWKMEKVQYFINLFPSKIETTVYIFSIHFVINIDNWEKLKIL